MRKFLVIIFTAIIFSGCNKDSSNSSSNHGIKIKYELVSSGNITDCAVVYSNETGSPNTEYKIGIGSNKWSKEFAYTNQNRPASISIQTVGLTSNVGGKATVSIYINGELKSSSSGDYKFIGNNIYTANAGAVYTIL